MERTPTSELHPDGTPTRLGRYRLVRPISTGGMARVFEGRRESLAGVSPRVAVKVILPNFASEARFRDLFINEARIGSMLHHQNLVQIQDFECERGVYYLVMEYVEGVTLRRCISLARRNGIQPTRTLITEIGRQICEGLHHLHTARGETGSPLGLVHRDIKPSNLILNPQGVVKILDFGVSKAFLTDEHRGAVRGTWGYMAPEQAGGLDAGPPADLFGVASVLYELVTLQALFPEKDEAHIRDLLDQDEAARRAARIMGQAGPLGPLLVRALQRDPAARFASADEFGRALAAFLPDPVTSREQLLQFQNRISELDLPTEAGPAPVAPEPPPRRSSLVAPVSLHADQGLPVSLGAGPPSDLHLESRPASLLRPAPAPPPWRALLAVLFTAAALGVIGFTTYHLFQRPTLVTAPPPLVKPPPAPGDVGTLAAPTEEEAVAPTPPAPEAPRPRENPTPGPRTERPPAPSRTDPPPPPPPPPAPAPAEAPAAKGKLTISSIPRARVIVDGKFIRMSPLYQHEVEAGPHSISLISEDGRKKTFPLEVPGGGDARRVWSFEEDKFIDE